MNCELNDDPRLSAWLLGEMEDAERAAFERELAADPEGDRIAGAMRGIAAQVETALASEPAYRLTDLQRARIFEPSAAPAPKPLPLELEPSDAESKILPWKRLRHTGDVTEKLRLTERMDTRRKNADFPVYAITGVAAVLLGMLVVGSILFFRHAASGPKAIAGSGKTDEEEVAISIKPEGGTQPEPEPEPLVVGATATGYVFRDPSDAAQRTSSFVLHPGSASYQAVSNAIRNDTLPNPAAVRIEEMVNYFVYDYPEPDAEQSMSVSVESAPCPWEPEHQLVHIGLKGREPAEGERPKQNIASDVDVQVEFDPAAVKEYRLIGYNHGSSTTVAASASTPEDESAREYGAGQTTTALYEIVPQEKATSADGGSVLTVRLNYSENDDESGEKRPRMLASRLSFGEHKRWSDATSDFRFAASVAGYGMLLSDPEESGTLDFSALESLASNALVGRDTGRRLRFVELIAKTRKLVEGK